jgi:hypothetical protein
MPIIVPELETQQSRLVRYKQMRYMVQQLEIEEDFTHETMRVIFYNKGSFEYVQGQVDVYRINNPRVRVELVLDDELRQVTFLHDTFAALDILFKGHSISKKTYDQAKEHWHQIIMKAIPPMDFDEKKSLRS